MYEKQSGSAFVRPLYPVGSEQGCVCIVCSWWCPFPLPASASAVGTKLPHYATTTMIIQTRSLCVVLLSYTCFAGSTFSLWWLAVELKAGKLFVRCYRSVWMVLSDSPYLCDLAFIAVEIYKSCLQVNDSVHFVNCFLLV